MQYVVDTEIDSSYYLPERTRHRFDTLEEAEAYTASWLAQNVRNGDRIPIRNKEGHVIQCIQIPIRGGRLSVWTVPEDQCCSDDDWEWE